MTVPFRVSKTHLELQDYIIDLETITEQLSEMPFKVESLPSTSQEFDINVQMELTFEMNRDLAVI